MLCLSQQSTNTTRRIKQMNGELVQLFHSYGQLMLKAASEEVQKRGISVYCPKTHLDYSSQFLTVADEFNVQPDDLQQKIVDIYGCNL